ncbi:plant invertase/pectin methylesterase inhibitor, partial [Striga asiatica]
MTDNIAHSEDVAGDRGSQFGPTKRRSKKTRSISTGQNLQKIWIANGKKKLPIEFDIVGKSWLPIGSIQKLYALIGDKINPLLQGLRFCPGRETKKRFQTSE